MPYAASAVVLLCEQLTDELFLLRLQCPLIASSAQPGQFLFVRPLAAQAPLLPRAFSIADVLGDVGVELIIRRVGRGTSLLTSLGKGETLTVVGPLGRGFTLNGMGGEGMTHVLVAGGVGVAPFPFLARRLSGRALLLYGVRTADEAIFLHRFGRYGVETQLATEDGSAGHHGFVTDLLHDNCLFGNGEVRLYACGPEAMLEKIGRFAVSRNVWCELSVESRMACGIGACYGCVKELSTGTGKKFARVCCDGPVFTAAELFGS